MLYSYGNMKKAKALFVFSLMAVAIYPSVTFAAWYNPFSWSFWSLFKKSMPAPVVLQVENKEPESTTTQPAVATSTEEKPVIVQPKAKPVQVTVPAIQSAATTATNDQVDAETISTNLAKVKENATKILNSRNATISSLQESRDSFAKSQYKDDYQSLIEVYDELIQSYSVEALMSTDIVNTISSAPASISSDDYMSIHNAYLELLAMANDTNAQKVETFAQLNNLVDLSKALVKARIEQEATNDVFAPYTSTGVSSADIEQQRAKVSADADAYLKNITDEQTKTQTERKEKIQTYLKGIFYSPIYRR